MTVRELASGIDALYLSGRVDLDDVLLADLDRSREIARSAGEPVPYLLGSVEFGLAPYGWGRYPYRLSHEYGLIGFTGSGHLPPVRVQPRAEMLHGLGPRAAVEAFSDVLGEVGDVEWSVGRVDLFADVQGWWPTVEERLRFVCRARTRDMYEEWDELNGIRFGRGGRGGLSARIYDKSKEAAKKGIAWWPDVWGSSYVGSQPVTRVEFQFGRTVLRQCDLDTPDDVLSGAAGLWGYATEWLSFRDPTLDQTRSRWPVSADWEAIRNAKLRDRPISIARTTQRQKMASERRLVAALCGYASSLAAVRNVRSIDQTVPVIDAVLRQMELETGIPFSERVAKKRRQMEWGL